MNINNVEYRVLRISERLLCSDYYYDGRNLSTISNQNIGTVVTPWTVGTWLRKTTAKAVEPIREGDPVGDLIEAARVGKSVSFRKHDPVAVAKAIDDMWAEVKCNPGPSRPIHAGYPGSVPTPAAKPSATESVNAERKQQDAKWGSQRDLYPDTWFRIMGEEVGEVTKALNDREPISQLRAELVQVAAVAVAWIEAIDFKEAA